MSDLEKKVQEEFDRWSDAGRAESMARGHHSMTIQCLEQWSFSPEDVVLDVGCGNGWAVREMCSRGANKGIGVDLSPKMIARAEEMKKWREEYHAANAEKLPLPDEHVDVILSVESLYYYENPSIALKEWFRVAKSGARLGTLIDLFFENDGSHAWVDALPIPVHLLGVDQYKELLMDAQWESISHQFFYDHRPRKTEGEFAPDPYWPSYADYLRFKEVGSLCLMATKP
jgi:ubiquinone/menaquinone biosynthesis C-methylase UbiE